MKYLKLIFLQVFWYLSIKFGSAFYFPLAALLILTGDYLLFNERRISISYTLFSIILVTAGFLMDQLFHYLKFISWGEQLYPFELLSVWIIFPCYYQQFFSRFAKNLLIPFFLGFIFGPLAYYSGGNISESVSLSTNTVHLIIIGFIWGGFFSASIKSFSQFVTLEADQ